MAKEKTLFHCTKCGAQFTKWSGRCLECQSWGTIEKEAAVESELGVTAGKESEVTHLNAKDAQATQYQRISTNIPEVDRVLGGGIVPGAVVLLGGEPGIGKSTLLLQIASSIPELLYVSAEESASQVGMRVKRLGLGGNIPFIAEPKLENILTTIKKQTPKLVIIDSIQTIFSKDIDSEPGNVSQIRACTARLVELAKRDNIAILIIGHITKDGNVAGPKTLEHLVDAVLYLEGDAQRFFRILRGVKNRFGTTNEIGVFEMKQEGLVQVENPSKHFLEGVDQSIPGSVVTVVSEGARSFLVEVQALVNKSVFGVPQRKASGYDNNRLQLLLAVLSKRLNLPLGQYDVYLNIIGGLKTKEVSIDLAICMAIISSIKDKVMDTEVVAIGEVGLGGEIRPISHIEKRVNEAKKLGFTKIYIPHSQAKSLKVKGIKLLPMKNLKDLVKK